jgi:hypothetical protein
MQTNPPNLNLDNDHASNQEIPEIGELTSGWSSDPHTLVPQRQWTLFAEQ